jgi:hypothetical protein
MHLDVRAVARLRGPDAVNVPAALVPVFETMAASTLDLSRVRLVCDWIQYRGNFRAAVECRSVLAERPPAAGPRDGGLVPQERFLEIAIDLRRSSDCDLGAELKEELARRMDPDGWPGAVLEPWVPTSGSCIWRFNALYWQALARWEDATGRAYEQALPGGQSDARNGEAAREMIFELLRAWDELDARSALPDELYIVELGVGNGSQARTWLDAFAELDRAHGRGYYRRLHYLMGDYSPHILERARQAVGDHSSRVSALVLDATRPQVTLRFLRGKAFCVYISNVYDNLPTDEIATLGGRPYLVEVRAYLPDGDAARIARRYGAEPAELPMLVDRLLRLGPDLLSEAAAQHFPSADGAVAFWQDVWAALKLQERYVPMEGLDGYRATPSLTGEILHPLLDGNGDVRMHVSNGALASFAETLPLLHPFGRLTCHDLFATEAGQYQVGFHGPGKYDGSVVNWVNGPLLQLAGNRRGFHVRIEPFATRPAASVKTLTATVRD